MGGDIGGGAVDGVGEGDCGGGIVDATGGDSVDDVDAAGGFGGYIGGGSTAGIDGSDCVANTIDVVDVTSVGSGDDWVVGGQAPQQASAQ